MRRRRPRMPIREPVNFRPMMTAKSSGDVNRLSPASNQEGDRAAGNTSPTTSRKPGSTGSFSITSAA